MECLEVGYAVGIQNNRLAIDNELANSVLKRGLNYPWIAIGEVVAAFAEQAHPLAVSFNAETVAIMFDFVYPSRVGWHFCAQHRPGELIRFTHAR